MIFQGKSIKLSELGHGIVELCFDREGDSVNKLDQQTVQELGDVVQVLLQTNSLKGVLVTSAKEAFIVGADITEFLPLFTQPDNVLREGLRHNNAVFSAFEDLPVPTVVAINGVALGGGFEMCLVADYRVMAADGSVGLPEVKLGIHPGWGGTVRLPRIIGVDNAIEWIASGSNKRAEQAMKDGAVDGVVPKEHLRDAALALLGNAISGKLDYKRRRAEKISAIKLNPFEQQMAFGTAKGYVAAQAGPNMPAPLAAVKCVEKNANLARNEALEAEADSFLKICKTPAATALIGIFLNDQMLSRRNRKFDSQSAPINMAGVLGAGIMGGGIAYQSAYKGTPVLMKDIAEQGLQLGLKEAAGLLSKQVERGKMTADKMAKVMGAIRPTLSYDSFDKLDIVVEAVVENPKVKHAVLSECESRMRDDAILASNTSTISIDYLASVLKRPESFCGMHFFNPVHKMPLVEVIRGKQSSDRAVATVVNYAKAMGKTPIVVNDCPGFYVNRVLFPYFMGFDLLLQDGADYRQIDKVMEKFGWPMGPAYLLDVVGIDTAVHAAKVMAQGFPDRMQPAKKSAAEIMFEAQRLGQKNGKGFYVYEMDKKGRPQKTVSDETAGLLKSISASAKEFSDDEIVARMMLPMCLEVVRCLDEKIVATPGDADLGLVMGLGFPPFRGGPIRYIDTIGVANFVALADKYASLGKLYEATDSLRQLAANNGHFYG